ncbi:MAG: hypothetical protein KAX31_02885 [Thermoplasmata archaeon]|nr:hypothetical protein [Thermoplasmata archaeon]
MSIKFIRCPKCKEFLLLERIGPVGVPRVKDSKIIKCLSCKTIFHTAGNTWKEEHGYLKV